MGFLRSSVPCASAEPIRIKKCLLRSYPSSGYRVVTAVTEGVCASHRLASDPAFLKRLKSDLVKKGDEGATGGAADEARATSERAMRTGDGQKTLFNWAAFLLPPPSPSSLRPSVCQCAARMLKR